MSIARAFTKRRAARVDASPPTPMPARNTSIRNSDKPIDRSLISPPVALLSTTNMLSYNAPDIATIRQVSSSSSSTHSSTADESDKSSISNHSKETFLTDASSVEGGSPTSPEPNHLSCYFQNAQNTKTVRRSVSTNDMVTRRISHDSPAIPSRAPSHSKRAHEASLARKRSTQIRDSHASTQSIPHSTHSAGTPSLSNRTPSISARTPSISASSNHRASTTSSTGRETARTSLDLFRTNVEPNHPFGKELEQLNEVAEEFVDTVRDADWEADAQVLRQKNLARFCATDYLTEISPLYDTFTARAPMVSVNGGGFF